MKRALLTMSMKSVAAAVAAFAASSVLAQGSAPSPLGQCQADNRDLLGSLSESLQVQVERNRMNPLVVARLQAMQPALATLKARQGAASRNLRDCESLTQAIAAEHDRLARAVGGEGVVAQQSAPRPALVDAGANVVPASVVGVGGAAVTPGAGGAATPGAGPAAAAMTSLPPAAGAGGGAAGDLQECRGRNADAYAEAMLAWRAAASARRLRPGVAEYDVAMARLRQLRDAVVRQTGGSRDCEALAQALQQEGLKAEGGGSSVNELLPARRP